MKILIIDDDQVSRAIITRVLAREQGTEVTEVGTAEEAQARLDAGYLPDLLVLDLTLPGMSGEDLLKHLRNRALWADLPIIVCSSVAERELISRIARLGIKGYLLKPLAAGRLRELFREVSRDISRLQIMEPAETVMTRLDVNATEFRELLELFLSEAERQLTEIKRTASNREKGKLGRQLNTFRATAGNIGASALATTAERLAERTPVADDLQLDGMIIQLEQETGRTGETIRRWMKLFPAGPAQPAPAPCPVEN